MTLVKSGTVEVYLGRLFRSWHTAHCAIVGNALELRKAAPDPRPFKRLSINNASVWPDAETFHSDRVLLLYHPLRPSVYVRLKDAPERDEWLAALSTAINEHSVTDARDDAYTSSDDESHAMCTGRSGHASRPRKQKAPQSSSSQSSQSSSVEEEEEEQEPDAEELMRFEAQVEEVLQQVRRHRRQAKHGPSHRSHGEEKSNGRSAEVLREAQHRLRDVCAPGERMVGDDERRIVSEFARRILGCEDEAQVHDVAERLVAHGNKELVQRFQEALLKCSSSTPAPQSDR
jgi:hypothetical protein